MGKETPGLTSLFSGPQAVLQPSLDRLPEVMIRQQVGDRGQKDRLSFTNLMRQIDIRLCRGHGEAEITEAVVKAITPGHSIRGILDIKRELTLPQLKAVLKGQFKQEICTDLYNRLADVSQDSRESPQNFLLRASDLRERLLLATKEPGADVCCTPELIYSGFRRSISTGLQSDSIKSQLKGYLDDLTVMDDSESPVCPASVQVAEPHWEEVHCGLFL